MQSQKDEETALWADVHARAASGSGQAILQNCSDDFCKMAWPDHAAARACITVFPHFLLETKVYIMCTTNDLTCNQLMATP